MIARLCLLLALCLMWAPRAGAQGAAEPNDWEVALSEMRDAASGYADDFDDIMGPFSQAYEAGSSAAEAVATVMEGYDALNDLDRQLDDAASQPDAGQPAVPSSCVAREGCQECFSGPYLQLARSRILLARARALYDATHRFATSSQAVGDTLAPATREAAFVWQMQKPRIAASLAQFDAAYDRKIADMIAVVRRTLQEISECEARFYNNPDWYLRYGFVYFEFLQTKYKRG